ncbi:aminotransferase class V-fold PLP-dependent enzyme [bacterium]|nr:aminotransferase class V-fold PLP-dependent enzyme [bacterium]
MKWSDTPTPDGPRLATDAHRCTPTQARAAALVCIREHPCESVAYLPAVNRIYCDCNATTPLAPDVLETMLPWLGEQFGNASSVHLEGRQARAAIDDARLRLTRLLGCLEGELVFTGGGTESCNQAIFGVTRARRDRGRHVVTSAIEHHAVLHACQQLEQRGDAEVTYLPVNGECLVDPDDLRAALRRDTVLVSLMAANNETGTIQPVPELAAICREHRVPFHTDAVQAFGKLPVNVNDWGVDLLSLAAHKIHGPKGTGALYIRQGTRIDPLLVGGTHEQERRAGTENVAGIVGLAAAAERAVAHAVSENGRLAALTETLAAAIAERVPDARRNGHADRRLGNTVNFSFAGCTEEGLLLGLDLDGIAVSSGSACAVGSLEPSHVLLAMGLPRALTRAAVRFSLGEENIAADIPVIVDAVARVVERLRQFA